MPRATVLSLAGLAALAAFLVLLPFACSHDTKTSAGDDASDDSGSGDDSGPDTTPPDPPTVDAVTSPTALQIQSLTGRAEAASITVVGGAAQATTYADDITGLFCVTVALVMNQDNALEVTATDDWRNTSEPTTVHITQDMSLYPQQANGALVGTASASSVSTETCADCTPNLSNDGDVNTYWENSTNPLNPDSARSPQWLRIDLGEVYEISYAEQVLWHGDDYGTHYQLWYSNFDSPVPPDQSLAEWTFAYEIGSGAGGAETLPLDVPLDARNWVLLLLAGNHQNPVSKHYYLSVLEFQLWGVPVSSIPVDPGCH